MTQPREPAQHKPAILSVDDDPSVSRAVVRDLRRRYGENYRIVRAQSGADALEALKEMKLRGQPVAILIADYRMPEMNGIEFLERAMDQHPYPAASCSRRMPIRTRRSMRSTSSIWTTIS